MLSCDNQSSKKEGNHALNVSLMEKTLTAGEIIQRIQKEITCDWLDKTVDTYKSGNSRTNVVGIATTFLATLDVLKRAHDQGLNMVITHEPTFYNHLDDIEFFKDDAVYLEKKAFIDEHDMVVFRFHDHWHMTEPDGIHVGMVKELGWNSYQVRPDEMIFLMPELTVGDLAKKLKYHFKSPAIRVVGDPQLLISKVGMAAGAPGSQRQIQMIRRDDVQVLIGGETHEWETVEWVRDAGTAGKKKALILIGHANSEEAGMEYCAEWLRHFVTEIPIEFIPAGDPFWGPE